MMYRRFLVLVTLLSALVIPSVTLALDNGFPGATWGEFRFQQPTTGQQDAILQGWIRQGVDLHRYSEDTRLEAYVTVRYTWDSQQNTWYNDIAPGVGIALDTYLGKHFPVTWGVEYLWDRYFVSPHTAQEVVLYMNWYGWWDLKN